MSTRRTPVTISALGATGAVALALGAWCGPAFASADVQAPCPELASHTESSLHEILGDDEITSPAIRALESTAKPADDGDKENLTLSQSDTPKMTTQFPGVSADDLLRFRQQMYRTDI